LPSASIFRYYDAKGRKGDIKSTFANGSTQLKARFKSRLLILSQLPKNEWHAEYCKALSGEADGLWELRFKADGLMQRPLGFHSDHNEFTLIFWAIEKSGKFVPKSACQTALAWKSESLRDWSATDGVSGWLPLE
jgi:hypothetical protein